jgi:protein gp37
MADKTSIEWCDATINPCFGCSTVSPACDNCYAARMAHRLAANIKIPPYFVGLTDVAGKWTGRVNLYPHLMKQVLRWQKPRRIFVGSMTDLFHPEVPDEFLDKVFGYMALASQHTFMLLTKRPERMRGYVHSRMENGRAAICHQIDCMDPTKGNRCGPLEMPLPNVWLGVTAENQAMADERTPILLGTPAAARFVSVEPMLGTMDLRPWLPGPCQHPECDGGSIPVGNDGGRPCPWCECGPLGRLDWVICGGESGPGARPMHQDWARSLRGQCHAAGVPFFFKQWGEWGGAGEDVDHLMSHWLLPDGRMAPLDDDPEDFWDKSRATLVGRVGKHRAGRFLDGSTHDEFPSLEPTA